MLELKEWDSFCVIVGSAAAALIGLQFVVVTLIAEKPARYGEAVELLKDLGEVVRRSGRAAEFVRRIRSLRDDHSRKLTFIRRLDDAGLGRQI